MEAETLKKSPKKKRKVAKSDTPYSKGRTGDDEDLSSPVTSKNMSIQFSDFKSNNKLAE